MLIETQGDLITYEPDDDFSPPWKLVPINWEEIANKAIMGAGLALQVKMLNPMFPYILGIHIRNYDTPKPVLLGQGGNALWWGIPTKYKPGDEKSSPSLMNAMLMEFSIVIRRQRIKPIIMLPRLGCGCGKLKWHHVKKVIEVYAKGEVPWIVVTKPPS